MGHLSFAECWDGSMVNSIKPIYFTLIQSTTLKMFFSETTYFSLFQLSRGIWEFSVPHWRTDSDVLRITLPIARAGGRLVTLNAAILLVTASKYFWTLIREHTVIPLGFPVDNIMPEYHRIVAWLIILSGCVVHTLPQTINYATQEIPIHHDKPVWTFGDGFST